MRGCKLHLSLHYEPELSSCTDDRSPVANEDVEDLLSLLQEILEMLLFEQEAIGFSPRSLLRTSRQENTMDELSCLL
ncbi:hypothetical protein EI42_02219 [Thermosporothrix hazakensis]|uniref:Uncharacterized protein n=1 Tax=Thermosporothrix hazakensis TaxID=644383 RepID=A0A326UBR2_THEHA|nr:hypothetical protein EI42_02219 [Thermosporothrix hazakensis]GCE50965.1 hypothetical protein KTH_58340 [Thermosporothrix hazakensis]